MSRDFKPGTALVVDDSELVLSVVADGLSGEGWQVRTATSGGGALAVLRDWMPEVVVSDLHMGDMTGFDLLQKAQLLEPDLPIIILSSDEDVNAVLGAVRRGAFDYVVKSDLGPLLASVERAAGHFRVIQENRLLKGRLDATPVGALPRGPNLGDLMTPVKTIRQRSNMLMSVAKQRGYTDMESELARIRQAADELIAKLR